MSRYAALQLPPDSRERQRAEELARDAGERGASRPPDEAFFGSGRDPSDSMIVAVLQAFAGGQLVRARQSDPGYIAAADEEMLQLPESV